MPNLVPWTHVKMVLLAAIQTMASTAHVQPVTMVTCVVNETTAYLTHASTMRRAAITALTSNVTVVMVVMVICVNSWTGVTSSLV